MVKEVRRVRSGKRIEIRKRGKKGKTKQLTNTSVKTQITVGRDDSVYDQF